MSAPTDAARAEVLARIHSALGRGQESPAPAPAGVPRAYEQAGPGEVGSPAVLDRLVDRLEDYKAQVHRCHPAALPSAVAAALAASGARRIVVPPGLDRAWLASSEAEIVADDPEAPLAVEVLDGVDGVVTGCAVAIADTGTIVLDASPDQGRRALTLVPDVHVIVVQSGQVVASVPEGVARMRHDRPLTLISGPSATSDIELSRVEGVHGPRTLHVVLVEG